MTRLRGRRGRDDEVEGDDEVSIPSPQRIRIDNVPDPMADDNENADLDMGTGTANNNNQLLLSPAHSIPSVQNHREQFEDVVPFDGSRAGLLDRLERVSIKTLMQEGTKSSSRWFIDFQLMRVISPINSSASNSAHLYSVRNRNRNTGGQTNYTRLFLVRVYSGTEAGRLCYIMETRTKNKDMWKLNVELRDNGTVTIGTLFRIHAPRPVENLMNGDIPLIESKFPAMVMKTPKTFLPVDINYQVTGNHCFAFCLKDVEISVSAFTPVSTRCSGCLCDKQRVDDHADSERGCGCYAMHHRRSNIAIQHDIEVSFDNGNRISMDAFSSTQFSKLYLSENLPPSILLQQLQMTTEMFEIEDKMQNVINFIHNQIGKFTVIGWYKRGVISDRSMLSDSNTNNTSSYGNNNILTNQVDNGDLSFHITQIFPTDSTVLRRQYLEDLKYDISQLH